MTRYTNYRKKFNKAEHSSGDRVEKPVNDDQFRSSSSNIEKMVQLRKKVCLKCRRRGHSLQNCPSNSDSSSSGNANGNSNCYKCGASDHTSKDCTSGTASYKFATCFVCSQQGHLASQCTQNPRGVYPNGGGCRFCGSVKHFVKDCDARKIKEEGGAVVEELDVDEPAVVDMQADEQVIKKSKKVKKVVSFK